MDFLIEICPLISRSSSLDPNCSSKDSVDILRWMCDASGAEAELWVESPRELHREPVLETQEEGDQPSEALP